MLDRLAIDQAYKHFIRFSASAALNVVMFQGIIEESARASRKVQTKYPTTYAMVSKENLDMVYFFVEQQLEPYLVFIEGHPIDCKAIQNKIYKKSLMSHAIEGSITFLAVIFSMGSFLV